VTGETRLNRPVLSAIKIYVHTDGKRSIRRRRYNIPFRFFICRLARVKYDPISCRPGLSNGPAGSATAITLPWFRRRPRDDDTHTHTHTRSYLSGLVKFSSIRFAYVIPLRCNTVFDDRSKYFHTFPTRLGWNENHESSFLFIVFVFVFVLLVVYIFKNTVRSNPYAKCTQSK